jgi:hypothetical protein
VGLVRNIFLAYFKKILFHYIFIILPKKEGENEHEWNFSICIRLYILWHFLMFEFLHPLLVNIFCGRWNDPNTMKIENKIFLENIYEWNRYGREYNSKLWKKIKTINKTQWSTQFKKYDMNLFLDIVHA